MGRHDCEPSIFSFMAPIRNGLWGEMLRTDFPRHALPGHSPLGIHEIMREAKRFTFRLKAKRLFWRWKFPKGSWTWPSNPGARYGLAQALALRNFSRRGLVSP